MDKNLDFFDPLKFSADENNGYKSSFILYSIFIFLILFVIWITFSEIDERVKGLGKIIPSGGIQTIQSIDGGSIKDILVKEGQIVKKGQPLLIIDETRFTASEEELKEELANFEVKYIRLRTQLSIESINNVPKLDFNNDLLENYKQYVENEINFYNNIIQNLNLSINVLDSQYQQKIQESNEIQNKIKHLKENLNFVESELKIIRPGVSQGAISKIELIQLEKEYSRILGELKGSQLLLSRSETAIKEAELLINKELDEFRSKTSEELTKLEIEIQKIKAKLTTSKDRLEKTVIDSPVNGVINQIYFTTIGGVIKPADSIMQIVPLNDSLILEAKVSPKDIGFISPNNKTNIKISAYDFSIYGGLNGKIEKISADSIFDEETKQYYYHVLISTEKNYLGTEENPLLIIPGMVCDVDILTGKKTILNYILKPISKTINNSLIER